MKGRFAPSPTGRMHLGNVYAALLSWLSARSQNGGWILRIEDLDPQRSRPEWADQVREDLLWLGLDWDEEYTQSERGDIYARHLEILSRQGLTYPCYCTRADIMATQAPHEADGRVVYKGTCRPPRLGGAGMNGGTGMNRGTNTGPKNAVSANIPTDSRPPATRIFVPDREICFTDGHYGPQRVNLAQQCGDFILRRGDGAWAYQLAVIVDDALMGVTEVVRGRDLLLSVPQQLYLYEQLGLEAPRFFHLPLLCNTAGQRLCKRDKSLDLGEMRRHHSPQEIIGQLACYAGLQSRPDATSPADLLPLFDWDRVPTGDIRIDKF